MTILEPVTKAHKKERIIMKIEIKNIRKSFSDKEVLHGISFSVESGRAMGFLGRNGAGKSTTIRCLMDVFKPNSGEFLLDGEKLDVNKCKIGYLPEERGMYGKNPLLEQLIYFAQLRGASLSEAKKSANEWIDFFELGEKKNKKLETLSKGNQQKIQIAQAFLCDPDIIILDEPFSGLDPVNADIFKKAIRNFVQKGKLVIFSSHQMSYVEELCDDICLIHNGEILLSGSLDDIKRQRGLNRLRLHTNDDKRAKEVLSSLSDIEIEENEKFLVIDTKARHDQKEILDLLLDKNLEIIDFGRFMPSLNDIFISLAGGEVK